MKFIADYAMQEIKQGIYSALKLWLSELIHAQNQQTPKTSFHTSTSTRPGTATMENPQASALQTLNSQLIAAAAVGDTIRVNGLLAEGADVHASVHSGWRTYWDTPGPDGGEVRSYDEPLKVAAENGHVETIRALLQAGAHVNSSNQWNNGSPIARAAAKGQTEAVKLLIHSGANVRIRNDKALRVAAEKGHTETVATLLAAGADVHAHAALHKAAENGHIGTVKVLLQAGAHVNSSSRYTNGDSLIVSGTAIEIAASAGQTEVVKLLIESGADVHGGALRASQEKGHAKVVEALLGAGATSPPSARERLDAELKEVRLARDWERALTRASKVNLEPRVAELLAEPPTGWTLDYRFVRDALKNAAYNGNAQMLASIISAVEKAEKPEDATARNDISPRSVLRRELASKTAYLAPALEIAEDLGHAEAAEVLRSTISKLSDAAKVDAQAGAAYGSAGPARPGPRQGPGQSFGHGSA